MLDSLRKGSGCLKCPMNEFDCDAQYRGSRCAAIRAKAGIDSDPMTNGDDVRSMSDEELAEFLEQVGDGGKCLVCENLSRCRRNNATEPVCSRHIKGWLQQPAQEVSNEEDS